MHLITSQILHAQTNRCLKYRKNFDKSLIPNVDINFYKLFFFFFCFGLKWRNVIGLKALRDCHIDGKYQIMDDNIAAVFVLVL